MALARSIDGGAEKNLKQVWVVLAASICAWVLALGACAHHRTLLGVAFLAYMIGIRHGLDADHISVIDNVTRKLMQEGTDPAGSGLYFALGHSTVVVGVAVAIILGAVDAAHLLPDVEKGSGLVVAAASSAFLLLIAALNSVTLVDTVRALRRAYRGQGHVGETCRERPAASGPMMRLLGPILRSVERPRRMYSVGLLFGLRLDTAAEVGMLAMATLGTAGIPPYAILCLPLLSTAAMALVDTLDGFLMLRVYGWAGDDPCRNLRYNMTVTLASVLFAGALGGIEAFGLIVERFQLTGPLWGMLAKSSDCVGEFGPAIVAIFVVSYLATAALDKQRRSRGAEAIT